MAGILYLCICFLTGNVLLQVCFPASLREAGLSFQGEPIRGGKLPIPGWFVRLPASFLIGTLTVTWAVYLTAYCAQSLENPLRFADAVVMGTVGAALAVYYGARFKKMKDRAPKRPGRPGSFLSGGDILFVCLVALLGTFLMWYTFFVYDGVLYTGYSVYSDFSPHIGLIQSIAKGDNFPTRYPFYAGEDIRYHFLFQFLAGNLVSLGLRIDAAFNLPSVFGFVSCCLLLYVLAAKITGTKAGGYLSVLLFLFRSSEALFDFLADIPEGTKVLKALRQNTEFIGETPNESWGLWNLNVYCNQRHFAFGLCGVLLLLLLFLPGLYSMQERRKREKRGIWTGIGIFFLTKEGWLCADIRCAVAAGVLLGGLAFFNGAAVIAALLVLFVIAIVSERRLELLIMAVITVLLALLQSSLFAEESVAQAEYYFGFIAANRTWFGVLDYLKSLLGILPVIVICACIAGDCLTRRLTAAFAAPLLFAFTVSLTPDVTVNHKYIMITVMLAGILAAGLLVSMFNNRLPVRIAAGVMVLMLTATGLYDLRTIIVKNGAMNSIRLSLTDPLTVWISENAGADDIFLTPQYALNRVVLGGAMLYNGWPYYAWSAGYDTDYRAAQVKLMYEAASVGELDSLIEANDIRYIIVDYDARSSADYVVREDIIAKAYEPVYQEGEGAYQLTVYDTQKELRQ